MVPQYDRHAAPPNRSQTDPPGPLICGLLGTIFGSGTYQHFLNWISLLANLVPPLIGPVIAAFYIVNKGKFDTEQMHKLSAWNPAAFLAYIAGAANTFYEQNLLVPSLVRLVVSMVAYLLFYYILPRRN